MEIKERTTHEEITTAAVLSDPATSYWLKDALISLIKRDPLDALIDAEILLKLAQRRARLMGLEV